MINLLILTGKINYADGVSSHLYYLMNELKKSKDVRIFLMCAGGDSAGRFNDAGIEVYTDSNLDHQNRSYGNFAKAIVSISKFCRQYKIDIIHSHNHYAANIAKRSSVFCGAKTVQTIHGVIPEGGKLNHFRADKYVAVSEPVYKHLTGNKIVSGQNVKLIRQGVPHYSGINKDLNGRIKIICASRLVYEKGVDTFIKAVKLVRKKHKKDISFFIAGTGEAEKDLRQLNEDLKTGIIFKGNVKDMPEMFLDSNIFVNPTRSVSEGFPMTIAEAASARNLIISSKFDWLTEIFKDGTDGLTFGIDDVEELAGKIIFALENRKAASRMADNFHIKSKKLFSTGTAVKKHLELYNECLKL